jgi:hypothetical protein
MSDASPMQLRSGPHRCSIKSSKSFFWGIVVALIASGFASAQVPNQASNGSPKNTFGTPSQLSGHVYRRDNGAPVSGAVVTLANRASPVGDPHIATTMTNSDGSFTFSAVSPRTGYGLSAECTGFVQQTYSRDGTFDGSFLAVGAGQEINNLDFRLAVGGGISGSVFDENNNPVQDVPVAAWRQIYVRGGHKMTRTAYGVRTDHNGDFRMAGVVPGPYYVSVEQTYQGRLYPQTYYPGVATTEQAQLVQVIAAKEASGIRIPVAVEKRYSISGKILDPKTQDSGQSYSVSISAHSYGVSCCRDGSFIITGIPAGEYKVTATARIDNGYEIARWGSATARVVDADVHQDIDIEGLAGEVRGKATLENQKGISLRGLPIRMDSLQRIGKPALDDDGNFDIQHLLPGDYKFWLPDLSTQPSVHLRVFGAFEIKNDLEDHYRFPHTDAQQRIYLKRVTCLGRDYTTQPFTIKSGEVITDCELTLAADTATISGQVLEKSKPTAPLDVVLIPESRELRQVERYTLKEQTDTNGRFQIPGVIPGTYFLFAVPPPDDLAYYGLDFADRNRNSAERVSVKSGETRTINLKPTTIQ